MTSFEAGKKQKDWGKAGGGMSPFHKDERVEKTKDVREESRTHDGNFRERTNY